MGRVSLTGYFEGKHLKIDHNGHLSTVSYLITSMKQFQLKYYIHTLNIHKFQPDKLSISREFLVCCMQLAEFHE